MLEQQTVGAVAVDAADGPASGPGPAGHGMELSVVAAASSAVADDDAEGQLAADVVAAAAGLCKSVWRGRCLGT